MFRSWKTTTTGIVMMVAAVFAMKKGLPAAWASGDPSGIMPQLMGLLGGIGLLFSRDHDVTSEQAGLKPEGLVTSSPTAVGGRGIGARPGPGVGDYGSILLFWGLGALFGFAILAGLTGCAKLQPGADPLVVRVEQGETMAQAAFDALLGTDDADRAFYREKVPAFHALAEQLREPVSTGVGTNTLPRSLAVIENLQVVKHAYQKGAAGSNDVVTALLTVTALADQARLIRMSATNLHFQLKGN